MAEHEPKNIVASPVFTAINLLLDQYAGKLLIVTTTLQSRFRHMTAPGYPPDGIDPHVRTRVSYETKDERRVRLPLDLTDVKQLRWHLDECERLDRAINELQRLKLRLLNDYDFTHGDTSEQIAVFGNPD